MGAQQQKNGNAIGLVAGKHASQKQDYPRQYRICSMRCDHQPDFHLSACQGEITKSKRRQQWPNGSGATSTGVHGAAFDHQSISDYIKGLHIIVGPTPADRIYLERDSEPVLNDAFAQMLDSRPVRDDEVFNAAIVGLGSFGFIAAIVMEVENIYSLKRYVRKIEYDDAVTLSETLDFENSAFRIPEETNTQGKPIRPYHFKTFFNQYSKYCVAEVMYKVPYSPTQFPPIDISTQLHPDLFRLMRWILDKSGSVAKLLTNLLQGQAMPKPGNPAPLTGTLGDIFRAVTFEQAAFSWALAVNQTQLRRAMEIWLQIFQQHRAPGLSALRLVRQSKATLGFQKFPVTAILHMDGVQWPPANAQQGIERAIINAYTREGIEFTLHWGKNADWNFPGLADIMYPTQKAKWIKQRCRLLRPEMAAMFSNDFLNRLGLDVYVGAGPVV